MIYLICGIEGKAAEKRQKSVLAAMAKKRPGADLSFFDSDSYKIGVLEGYFGLQGLFEQKCIVVLRGVMENKEFKEDVAGKIKEMKDSGNLFLVIEKSLDKKTLDKLEKNAEKAEITEIGKTEKKDSSMFALGDAFGARDKKRLWLLFRDFADNDVRLEEMHGILFWQIKNIVLAERSKNAAEAGLHYFVYDKSKAYSKKFKAGEAERILGVLVEMYHDAHRGKVDFENAMEQLILSI